MNTFPRKSHSFSRIGKRRFAAIMLGGFVAVSSVVGMASTAQAGGDPPDNPGATYRDHIGNVYFNYSYANQWLNAGDSWTFGNAHLVMQNDGNLVIYKKGTSTAKWATRTNGSGAKRMQFQKDGNLVLYKANGAAVWSSKSTGKCSPHLNANEVIALQDDSNLVIYCDYPPASLKPHFVALWATGTNGI